VVVPSCFKDHLVTLLVRWHKQCYTVPSRLYCTEYCTVECNILKSTMNDDHLESQEWQMAVFLKKLNGIYGYIWPRPIKNWLVVHIAGGKFGNLGRIIKKSLSVMSSTMTSWIQIHSYCTGETCELDAHLYFCNLYCHLKCFMYCCVEDAQVCAAVIAL